MQKVSTIVLYILSAISIALALWFFFGGREMINGIEVPKAYDENLLWAGILLALSIVITFGFAIEFLITHPKALKGALIAIVAGGILLAVSYFLASDAPIEGVKTTAESTPTTRLWVDVGLIATYILGGLAVVSMVFSEIFRAFR